jgi:plastocyanin
MTPAAQTDEAKTRQSSHAIEIQHDGKAFVYRTAEKGDGTKIKVRTGDVVKWTSHVGNYSILFKGKSPFEEIAAHGSKGTETRLLKVTATEGEFHYGVTLALPDKMIVDDPVIIVGGGGDGGF